MEITDHIAFLHWLYAIALGIVGLAIGSFLNVVTYRVPNGMNLLRPPSTCPRCGKRIASRDNIPVFGWLLLGGKCRACRNPISPRYPMVELVTGILWAFTGWRLAGLGFGFWTDVFVGLLALLFVSAMIVTILVDWDFQIILDEISLGGLVIALIAAPLLPVLHHAGSKEAFALYDPVAAWLAGDAQPWIRGTAASCLGAVVGLAFSLGIYFMANVFFRRQIEEARKEDPEIDSALGLGDVKLMALFGAFLGWISVPVIFFGGSILGALMGTAMKVRSGDPGGKKGLAGIMSRWRTGDSVLPFGPFLVAAALLYFYWGEEIRTLLYTHFDPSRP